MQKSKGDYPNLASLLSGWFHQDFDIEGETVDEIINAYNRTSSDEECRLLTGEIVCFLETYKDSIDDEFTKIFNPDIEATGFASSTQAFLQEILRHINNKGDG